MTDKHCAAPSSQGDYPGNFDIPIWGAAAIAKHIGRSERQTLHLLSRGLIRSARKVGGSWTAIPSALRREFGGAAG
jgi:hypothetical protein